MEKKKKAGRKLPLTEKVGLQHDFEKAVSCVGHFEVKIKPSIQEVRQESKCGAGQHARHAL